MLVYNITLSTLVVIHYLAYQQRDNQLILKFWYGDTIGTWYNLFQDSVINIAPARILMRYQLDFRKSYDPLSSFSTDSTDSPNGCNSESAELTDRFCFLKIN